nr:tyrosine-type recombinase/integrase [Hydrogenovibrio sp. SC-1]
MDFLYEKNTQEADYLLLLFATGARKNELAELPVRDIKFLESDNSSLISLLLKKTKNSEARTARIFIQNAENAIKRIIEGKDLDDYVFYDSGTLYGICDLKPICDELKEHFHLDHFTAHDARHSFAVFLYKQTKELNVVKRRLGHKSLKQTQTYLASLDILEEEEDDMLDDTLSQSFA